MSPARPKVIPHVTATCPRKLNHPKLREKETRQSSVLILRSVSPLSDLSAGRKVRRKVGSVRKELTSHPTPEGRAEETEQERSKSASVRFRSSGSLRNRRAFSLPLLGSKDRAPVVRSSSTRNRTGDPAEGKDENGKRIQHATKSDVRRDVFWRGEEILTQPFREQQTW